MQTMYGTPTPAYPPMVPGGAYGQQYNNVPNVSDRYDYAAHEALLTSYSIRSRPDSRVISLL